MTPPKVLNKAHVDGNGSSSDQILDWFEKYIESNQLSIGDPLPSEDYIVTHTNMSRTSVREAMTRLRAIGIIDTRRKRGMQLRRSPALLDLTRLLSAERLPMNLVGHVGGFRSALELGMESEIFDRAGADAIAELRAIYEAMVSHSEQPEQWHELDLHFHERLIRITQNKVAIWLSQLFRPFFLHIRGHESSMSEQTREKHRRIVVALENRDAIGFYMAMREHHYGKLSFDRVI